MIENDLKCSVVRRKSITLASSESLRKKIAKALGPQAGQVASSGKNFDIQLPSASPATAPGLGGCTLGQRKTKDHMFSRTEV